MKKFILIAFFLTLFLSSIFAQITLKKVSEFKIDSFYEVGILDYFEKDKIYLGYTKSKGVGVEISLFDSKGNKLISKNLYGEGPNEHVSPLSGLAFSEDGNIWGKTSNEILLYDRNLKLISKTRFSPLNTTTIYYPKKLEIFKNMVNKEQDIFITAVSNGSSFFYAKDFKNLNLVEGVNLKSKKSFGFIPFSTIPIFSKMEINMKSMISPIYTLSPDGKLLYVTSSFDDQVSVFHSPNSEKKNLYKIKHKSFDVLSRSKISLHDLPQFNNKILSGRNFALFAWADGLLGLEYLRDIPLGTFEKKSADNKYYSVSRDPAYHSLILFKAGKQISGDISIPYGEIQMPLPGNRLLIRLINPDLEEDFMRFGIFELK